MHNTKILISQLIRIVDKIVVFDWLEHNQKELPCWFELEGQEIGISLYISVRL